MAKLFKLWRLLLPFLFLFIFIHFLKDITQDILGIKTPLDIFGDVKEDLSWLPKNIRSVYLFGLGGLSFLAEGFLLISIPFIWKRQSFSKLEKYIVIATAFLLLFFITAILLDPNYRTILIAG
jgi:hypothetical protein